MASRFTRPMVVGPFRPATRTVVFVLADAPQASIPTSSAADSSRDVSFFIIVLFLPLLICSNREQICKFFEKHLLYRLKFTIIEPKIPLHAQRNRQWAVRARRKPHRTAMENILPLLRSTSLFTGIEDDALRALLSELGAVIRSYGKGEALVQAGGRAGNTCR